MKFTTAFCLWVTLVAYALLKPGNPWDVGYLIFEGDDKLVHLGIFAVTSWLLALALQYEWRVQKRKSVVVVIIFGGLLAFATETLQQFIPYRSADIKDFLADMSGVTAVVLFQLFLKKVINHCRTE